MRAITAILVLSLFLVSYGAANAQILYGVAHLGSNGPSTLYTININNGAATAVGPVGFERCGSLAFDEITETLFALCERTDGSDEPVLVNINPNTGVGTEVGPTESCDTWTDLSFRNSDNTLFAVGFGEECDSYTLAIIDKDTAETSIVGVFDSNCCGNALSFSENDTLYFGDGNFGPPDELFILNQNTAQATFVTSLQYPPNLDRFPRPNGMDFNPNTNALFMSIINGGGEEPPRENFVGITNTATGNVTVVGPTVEGLDGIAFGPRDQVAIPTLSEWGLIAMAGVLGIIGFFALRRPATA